MRKLLIILLSLTLMTIFSCGSSNDDTNEPKQLFIKANQSSLKVNDAQFKVNLEFKSPQENFSTTLDVSLLRDKNTKAGYIVLFKTDEGSGLYDGEKYYYKNDKTKQVFISGDKIAPEMFITQNWISQPISMVMLSEDYTQEIKNRKDELFMIGESKYSSFNTTVVESIHKEDSTGVKSKIRTYFDLKTNLPVKEVKIQVKEEESITQTLNITDLSINKGLDRSIFKMEIPEGYATEIIRPDSEPEPENVNSIAPDFTLKDLNGKEITLSKLKGSVVVLDFWGTWCHWCVKAMPKLQNVHEHFKGKNVVVLGISCQERAEADPKKFMADNKVTYNSLIFGDKVAAQYGVRGYPTLYVISKDGKILTNKSGFSETMDKELIELIEKNL